MLNRYWEAQIEIGESIQGWIFWTWKVRALPCLLDDIKCTTILTRAQAENADEWSYLKGLEGGWIPQDPTNRLYPNICSSD
jgi:glucan 1,3-beta-glucosidase